MTPPKAFKVERDLRARLPYFLNQQDLALFCFGVVVQPLSRLNFIG
jgi:hypothetical protein